MLKLVTSLCITLSILPLAALAEECEVEAKVGRVEIHDCGGERFLGTVGEAGTLNNPIHFDAIPLGLETFWSNLCQCYLWQVSGLAGAHTHIVLFLREGGGGSLSLIPGGEFGSEVGKISRISQLSGFIVEVREGYERRSQSSDKYKESLRRYRFDRRRFLKSK